jgi:anti-sigma factor RsiW
MPMRCKKVLSHLNAYADHELSDSLSREIDDHLRDCGTCRIQFERILRVGDSINALGVLPVPDGFADRVMAEARSRVLRSAEKKSFFTFNWLSELSIPVRLAACTTVLLAFFLGMTMSREISLAGSRQATASREAGMEGFEWFSPAPPESIEHAYMILASSFDAGGTP